MKVKSVRLTPTPVSPNSWYPDIFKITIKGYRDVNDANPVVETVDLDPSTMTKAKRVGLGKKFKKVEHVLFVSERNQPFGLDNIQVKIRAKKPCQD